MKFPRNCYNSSAVRGELQFILKFHKRLSYSWGSISIPWSQVSTRVSSFRLRTNFNVVYLKVMFVWILKMCPCQYWIILQSCDCRPVLPQPMALLFLTLTHWVASKIRQRMDLGLNCPKWPGALVVSILSCPAQDTIKEPYPQKVLSTCPLGTPKPRHCHH